MSSPTTERGGDPHVARLAAALDNPPMSDAPAPTVWAEVMTELAEAGDRFAATMRERGEEADGDVYLTMLGIVMNDYLTRVSADADHPTFVPSTGYFQRLGSPNPDTVYRSAPVDPSGTYRLTGDRGTAWQVTIMPFTASMQSRTPYDFDELTTDASGRFDVIVSAERPGGHTGDWWTLEPDVGSLWVRSVSDRWGEERDPRIAIERLDVPSRRRRGNEDVERRLRATAGVVAGAVGYGIRHVDELHAEGFVNRLKPIDYGASGGMPRQHYHEGLFDLGDDEALLVDAHLPAGCDYVSWSLTDRLLVTLDWTHAQTSLNRSQATIDDDRVLRVVVSGRDPGVRNWMDTTGYQRGVLQCRAIGSVEAPTLTTRVVPVGAVLDHLPAGTARVTPEERAAALEKRRRGFQLRSLW